MMHSSMSELEFVDSLERVKSMTLEDSDADNADANTTTFNHLGMLCSKA